MKYKKYKLKLTTLAPVHIGSGEKRNSREFIYENGSYYFPDMGKLYFQACQKGPAVKRDFENFFKYTVPTGRSPERLIDFLRKHRITDRNFGGFKISKMDEKIKNGKLNDIHLFTRDPYGKVYIPGSSIKGALRTIVESEAKTHLNIDWNHLRVEDSITIPAQMMTIAQKVDYSLDRNDPKDLPIYRESIQPLKAIPIRITAIDDECIQIMDNLVSLANKRYERYTKFYLNECPNNYIQDNFQNHGPLYLGAGSGLWTKVDISDQVSMERIIEKKQNMRKNRMKGKGTLKLTRYPKVTVKLQEQSKKLAKNIDNNTSYYEMGKCNFTIEELN